MSNRTIAVTMPYATNVSALVASFTTTGASVAVGAVAQSGGSTANNFSSPLTYSVSAADGSTASYTVTVTVARTLFLAGPSSTRGRYWPEKSRSSRVIPQTNRPMTEPTAPGNGSPIPNSWTIDEERLH